MANTRHVVPRRDGSWANIADGAGRATSVHNTRQAAINAARALAIRNDQELKIHGTDGKIRESNTYTRVLVRSNMAGKLSEKKISDVVSKVVSSRMKG